MTMFKGQVAIITGASSGIGKAIALHLAVLGVRLGLIGRDFNKLEAIATKALLTTDQVHIYQTDLMVGEEINAAIAAIKQDFSQVDMLIHSAGVISKGSVEAASLAAFDRHYRLNVRAPYALSQALLPALKARGGQIVFINSSVALMTGKANFSQYVATKQALKGIADSLRTEVNGEGVRVLSVYPGRTATPMQAALHQLEGVDYEPDRLLQAEDVALTVVNTLSLPPTAEITDIRIRPMLKS